MSSLPIGLNQIEIQRGLTTSSTAIFVPFTTQELFQDGKEALYCGINALSNNLIMVDRKLLKNPNGLILGTPGSGKSFSAKREITNVFLVTEDDIIICDPESEYGTLVERLNGQVIHISPTSTDFVNPMDLNLNYSDDENPLSLKSDFILSLCELILTSEADETASVFTFDRRLKAKLERLNKSFPELIYPDKEVEHGAVSYIVPKSCIVIYPPQTEKCRNDARERAKMTGFQPK